MSRASKLEFIGVPLQFSPLSTRLYFASQRTVGSGWIHVGDCHGQKLEGDDSVRGASDGIAN